MALSHHQEDQGQIAIDKILSSPISHRRKIQALSLIEPYIRDMFDQGLTKVKPASLMTDDDLTH